MEFRISANTLRQGGTLSCKMRRCCSAVSPLVIALAITIFLLFVFSAGELAITLYLFLSDGFDSLPSLILLIGAPSLSILYITVHTSTVICARTARGRFHAGLQKFCRACILGLILLWIATVTTDFALNRKIWNNDLRGILEKTIIGTAIAAFLCACAIFFFVHRDENSFGDLHIKSYGRSPLPVWQDDHDFGVHDKSPWSGTSRPSIARQSTRSLYLSPRPSLSRLSVHSQSSQHLPSHHHPHLTRDSRRSHRASSIRSTRSLKPILPPIPPMPSLDIRNAYQQQQLLYQQQQQRLQQAQQQWILPHQIPQAQADKPRKAPTARYSIYPPARNPERLSNSANRSRAETIASATAQGQPQDVTITQPPLKKVRTLHSLHSSRSSSSRSSAGSSGIQGHKSPLAALQTVDESRRTEFARERKTKARGNDRQPKAVDVRSVTKPQSKEGDAQSKVFELPSPSPVEVAEKPVCPPPLIVRKVDCRQVHPTPSRDRLKHQKSLAGSLVRMHIVSATPTEEEMQELCRVLDAESSKLDDRLDNFSNYPFAQARR